MSGFTEYALTAGRQPLACCLGPDGNVWYVSNGGASRVCKITPGGTVTEYDCPDSGAALQDICAGPDGNLWAIGYTSNKVYKVTPAGSFTSYSSGITAAAGLYSICAGPDGNLWFAELGATKIGKITTSGTVTEYSSGITASSQPIAIASDGTDLWFTEYHATNGNRVCKITTSGTVTEYAIATGTFRPCSLTLGPDGRMWVGSFNTDKVIAVTVSDGTRTEYTVSTGTAKPAFLTVVNGHLYAILNGSQKIVPITTSGVAGTAQSIPTGSAGVQARICTGADGASVWFCEYSNAKIGFWSELAAVTDTWGWSDAPVLSTRVQRFSGGRFYANDGASNVYIDSTKRITEHGTASAVSSIFPEGGVANLADSGAGYLGYTLNGPGASNNGQADITVDNDIAVCADVGAFSANCAAAINIVLYQDGSNHYRLEVAKTAGGTSTLYKKVAGVETAVATVSKGVALNARARVQLYRNGSSALGLIVDGVAGTYTDPSPLSGPFTVYLGAPASSGTSDNRVTNIEVTYGTKVRVLGCPTGGGAAFYDAGGSLITSASESSGIATLDLAGQQFPLTGSVRVLSSVSPAKNVPDGRFPYSGTTAFYGGDDLYYRLSSSTGVANVKVLTTNAEATYPTTQTGSHNGVVVHGTKTIAAWLGFGGKVYASSYDDATGEYLEQQIGTHADMHSTCDLQADSTGILHFVWGGSTIGEQTTKYRKSNTAWSITDLGGEVDLGEKIRGSLLIDASNNLFLVGSRSNSASYDQMVCKKCTSAGSWQSTVVIANADASWAIYPCDATLGRDGKIHAMWMAWSAGTGFEHAFHAKSTDGSTWTGITGTSLSLPLSQNSGTGKLSNSATLAADGDYGVSRITVDSDGTVHAVIGRNASTYAYFKGSSSTGWPGSATYSFTGTVYSNHGAIERFGNYLVYITCTPGSNALYRWLSQDGGTTWTQTTALALPGGTRDIWWWPKLTPVAGSAYAKSVWTGRGTVYANKDGSSPLSGAGQGALYIADISVVLDVSAGDTWGWADSPSRAFALPRAPADTWTWSDVATRAGSGPASRTAGDTWAWADSPTRVLSSTRTPADTWAWTDTAGGSVATHSYARTAGDTWAWADSAGRGRVVKLPATADFVSARSQTANFASTKQQSADFAGNRGHTADFIAGPT